MHLLKLRGCEKCYKFEGNVYENKNWNVLSILEDIILICRGKANFEQQTKSKVGTWLKLFF